ncbi:GntR family transcriptional regulator [Pontibacillus halophilus JSM 076056 = DSM 19796]|uniref:GntR family transcriptional regulator n=1 Tax=Pontibacillus halophilus JSM 076056 = DSM 19796 TaxID=1385510 RepID=A0A0A5GK05_9BACI|nr:GntR family transcriptional regulator [Pontibacillus halophilus]KGX92344.1 GntR family transcriptional regulator [Pontibacillus halophilus JSM 076056 = DSM 19796]
MRKLIDPNKEVALYIQLKDVFIQRIQNGEWGADKLIPTEQALMKEFDVSRTTIRQAISLLVQEGLLEKKQGRGTIVKPRKLIGNLGQLKGFAEEVLEKGQTPRSQFIRAEFKTDLHHERSMLNVEENEPILLVERIRFADDVPVALERTCWPQSIGNILMEFDLNEARYYEILEKYNVYLNRASEKISAINATIQEADLLGIRAGEALLEMTRLSLGVNGEPIEYTKTKYRNDQYHYSIELKR